MTGSFLGTSLSANQFLAVTLASFAVCSLLRYAAVMYDVASAAVCP